MGGREADIVLSGKFGRMFYVSTGVAGVAIPVKDDCCWSIAYWTAVNGGTTVLKRCVTSCWFLKMPPVAYCSTHSRFRASIGLMGPEMFLMKLAICGYCWSDLNRFVGPPSSESLAVFSSFCRCCLKLLKRSPIWESPGFAYSICFSSFSRCCTCKFAPTFDNASCSSKRDAVSEASLSDSGWL